MARLPFPEVGPGPLRMLLRELHELHARAGWPSTRELARGQSFSHVAVHDLMTKAPRPPKLPVLLAVVKQLAELAPRIDVEAALDDFDKMWKECVGDVVRPGEDLETTDETGEPLSPVALQTIFERFSARELEVISLLASGLGVNEIAARKYVSHGSVRSYVNRILEKLHVKSRAEAIERFNAYKQVRDHPDEPRPVGLLERQQSRTTSGVNTPPSGIHVYPALTKRVAAQGERSYSLGTMEVVEAAAEAVSFANSLADLAGQRGAPSKTGGQIRFGGNLSKYSYIWWAFAVGMDEVNPKSLWSLYRVADKTTEVLHVRLHENGISGWMSQEIAELDYHITRSFVGHRPPMWATITMVVHAESRLVGRITLTEQGQLNHEEFNTAEYDEMLADLAGDFLGLESAEKSSFWLKREAASKASLAAFFRRPVDEVYE